MQGYAHVKRHIAWTRIITHSMDRVTCAREQRLVELHCITSVVAARLLADGCRKAKKMMSKGSSELTSTSSSPSPSPSSSSSPDVAVIKESTLALAILGVGLVTFHAVESRDTSADVDTAVQRDEECRRLFSETAAEGDGVWLLMALQPSPCATSSRVC